MPDYHSWPEESKGIPQGETWLATKADYKDTQLRNSGVEVKYIVGQGMYPAKANGTMVRSTHRRWQVVDNLDEARRLMSYWRDAQVYRLQGDNIHPLAVQPRVYHHALCDFSWYEGERPCTCEGFDSVDKGIISGL